MISPNSLALLAILCLLSLAPSSSVLPDRAFLHDARFELYARFPRLDPEAFMDGDVILRRGRSFASSMIARAFPAGEQMSHCGILLQDGGSWKVIHSISGRISDSDGLRIDSVEDFLQQAVPGMAVHVSPSFEINRARIVQASRYYLAQKLSFDHDYELEDRQRLYCSELVRAVYLDAGAADVFSYLHLAGRDLVDFASFFDEQHWSPGG